MNRLHKKCFIASAGVHSLLLLILLIGPAFLAPRSIPDEPLVMDFIPSRLAEQSSGGNRNATPPPPAAQLQPSPPAPKPPPKAEEPPKQTVPVPRHDPDALDAKSEPRHKKLEVNTTIVTRKSKTKPAPENNDSHQREVADQKRRIASQFAKAASQIGDSISSATDIEYGPGTDNGPATASYASEVKRIYESAWQAPEDVSNDNAVTKVSVTINSDGWVASSHIVRPSGDSSVDKSVQRTLDRVTFIARFPEGSKDHQRTFIINFNLRAKRGLA